MIRNTNIREDNELFRTATKYWKPSTFKLQMALTFKQKQKKGR